MLYYDRIDFSKGINIDKASASKEYIICFYRYFLNKEFKSQTSVCNCCLDVSIISFGIDNISILYIHGVDYCCIIF